MTKVFVVYSIPDYIGIDIEACFFKESDAIDLVSAHNAFSPSYDKWDYFEQEVI